MAPLEAALFDTHTKTHQLLSLGPLPIPLQELRPRLYQWVQTFPAGERCLVFEDPEWRLSGVGGMWGTCRGYGQSRESGLKPVVGPGWWQPHLFRSSLCDPAPERVCSATLATTSPASVSSSWQMGISVTSCE